MGTFGGEPPRLRRHWEYPVPPPPPPNHVSSLYMLHGWSSFYLSRAISVSKVIQREKWNQAL